MSDSQYDALVVVSFGGPEAQEDVMPFLENVLRGKNVPHERMLEVAEHYKHFGGVSPINEQNRRLVDAIKQELSDRNINLPVFWANRNWHPLIPDTLRHMQDEGIKNALAFFTSMYSSYSGCRQYRENIRDAQASLGAAAPEIHKLRMAFNHPLFIDASSDRVTTALAEIPAERQPQTQFIFTAHSIPMSMADGCKYETQLRETCRLVMEQVGDQPWYLVYQSRSGPPHQPWLEPDICDFLADLKVKTDCTDVVIMPIGFISDHMEVLFDLDTEAKQKCESLEINLARAKTVGVHPKFVSMIAELILERIEGTEKRATGSMPPNWDVCPADCCTYERPKR